MSLHSMNIVSESASTLDLQGVTGLSEEEAQAACVTGRAERAAHPEEAERVSPSRSRSPASRCSSCSSPPAACTCSWASRPTPLMLLGFVFVVMAITIVQERRTERALDALRDLSSPRALGHPRWRRIGASPGREVVRGDLVVLAEGDRVPADGLLRRGINLSADESLLTGESVPVRKLPSADAAALDAPGGDDLPVGLLRHPGHRRPGHRRGPRHRAATRSSGKIGKALQQVEPEPTLLQKETGRLVRTFAIVGLVACALVVVAFALDPRRRR